MAEKSEALNFERSLEELEALVEKMEEGELSLEDSLQTYERGIKLTRSCQKALDEAQQRIEILAADDDEAKPFEAESGGEQ